MSVASAGPGSCAPSGEWSQNRDCRRGLEHLPIPQYELTQGDSGGRSQAPALPEGEPLRVQREQAPLRPFPDEEGAGLVGHHPLGEEGQPMQPGALRALQVEVEREEPGLVAGHIPHAQRDA